MPQDGGIYENMRVNQAENGWVLKYMVREVNPMEPRSDFGPSMTMVDKKEVFEMAKGVSMEQALDKAVARHKEFLLLNMENKA